MPPPHLILELSAAPQGIPRARAAVTQLCDTLNVSNEVKERIRLAVTEACTNCVLHAYDGDAADSAYRLEAREEPGEIVVVVQDWGSGLEGDGDTEEARRGEGASGRGMAVMQAVATSMEIATAVGLGTRVELHFALT
jgi:anti-sigma regulatory factor (Ser/Thr protein kinase)